MTEISHIVSSDLLHLIDGREFYMCLANIASKDENYCNFYADQVKKGAFVLLDNGAAESDQMTLDVMWSVIEKINPTEVILNDCLMNGAETIRRSLEARDFYESKGYKGQYMFVPQGKDFLEWGMCLELMDKTDISTIGVSKFVTSGWNLSDARHNCCNFIDKFRNNDDSYQFKVHLLGCHENIEEVADCAKDFPELIRSNDTAIAYIYALANKKITDGDRPSGEINFIKSELSPEQVELLKQNINIFDSLFYF